MTPVRRIVRMLRGDAPPPTQADRALARDVAALHQKIDRLTATVERLASGQKQDAKWRMIFRKQLNALVRSAYLGTTLPAPRGLEVQRFRLRSQNEEDGIVLALLRAAGVDTRRFLEIGSGGTGGNSAVLAYELGWQGVMIDGSGSAVRAARQVFAANPGVTIVRKMVAPETINGLLEKMGALHDVDFLSIDIDSTDYWILEALEVKARVLVLEYNAYFGPERAVTVPNAPRPEGAPKGYSGASLAAMTQVAARRGYRLVLCEDAGVNAFFVRNDLAPEIPTLTPAQAFRPLENKYDAGGDSVRQKDLLAQITERGLPLVDI